MVGVLFVLAIIVAVFVRRRTNDSNGNIDRTIPPNAAARAGQTVGARARARTASASSSSSSNSGGGRRSSEHTRGESAAGGGRKPSANGANRNTPSVVNNPAFAAATADYAAVNTTYTAGGDAEEVQYAVVDAGSAGNNHTGTGRPPRARTQPDWGSEIRGEDAGNHYDMAVPGRVRVSTLVRQADVVYAIPGMDAADAEGENQYASQRITQHGPNTYNTLAARGDADYATASPEYSAGAAGDADYATANPEYSAGAAGDADYEEATKGDIVYSSSSSAVGGSGGRSTAIYAAPAAFDASTMYAVPDKVRWVAGKYGVGAQGAPGCMQAGVRLRVSVYVHVFV